MAAFHFELVSPEKLLFSGDVDSVVAPGAEIALLEDVLTTGGSSRSAIDALPNPFAKSAAPAVKVATTAPSAGWVKPPPGYLLHPVRHPDRYLAVLGLSLFAS